MIGTTRWMARIAVLAASTTLIVAASVAVPSLVHAANEVVVEATLLGGYSPQDVVVQTGTTVVWRNAEPVPPLTTAPTGTIAVRHQLVSEDGSIESPVLLPGQSFAVRFDEPTTISYLCKTHPTLMKGSVTVEGDAVVPAPTERSVAIVEPTSEASSWGYDPADLVAVVGTTVTWRNDGATAHTVTADDGSFDSGSLAPGDSFTMTFDTPLATGYLCTPHPWMTGTVAIAEQGKAPPVVPPRKPSARTQPGPGPRIEQPVRTGNAPTTFQARIVEGSISDPDSWGYDPASLRVRAGDSVVWTNVGAVEHTVTGQGFDSDALAGAATFRFTFASVGTFAYACAPHPWMTGVVEVVAVSEALDGRPLPSVPLVPPPGSTSAAGPGDDYAPTTDRSAGSAHGKVAPWTLGNVALAAGSAAALGGVGILLVISLVADRARGRRRKPDQAVG